MDPVIYVPLSGRICPPETGSCISIPYAPPVPSEVVRAYQQYSNNQAATFYGNLATQYAQQGNVTAAKQIAAVSGGAISVSDSTKLINSIAQLGAKITVTVEELEEVTVSAAETSKVLPGVAVSGLVACRGEFVSMA